MRAGVPQGTAPALGAEAANIGRSTRTPSRSRPRSGTTTRPAARRRGVLRCGSPTISNSEDLKDDPPAGLAYEELAVWKYQRYMRDYLACVHSVDDNVGRLIDWLRDRGDFDDTMLMYSSDQGFFLGDHGWFDKRLMYEESLRMPFVLSYPRHASPSRRTFDGIVTNVDIAQTILDAAGVEHHPGCRAGASGPTSSERPRRPAGRGHVLPVLGERRRDPQGAGPLRLPNRPVQADLLLQRRLRAAVHRASSRTRPNGSSTTSQADPNEMNNVYDDPAYLGVREELKAAMWREQARLGDAPHASQPVPDGCEDVEVAAPAELPVIRWLTLPGME